MIRDPDRRPHNSGIRRRSIGGPVDGSGPGKCSDFVRSWCPSRRPSVWAIPDKSHRAISYALNPNQPMMQSHHRHLEFAHRAEPSVPLLRPSGQVQDSTDLDTNPVVGALWCY